MHSPWYTLYYDREDNEYAVQGQKKKYQLTYLHISHEDPLVDDMIAVSVLLSRTF